MKSLTALKCCTEKVTTKEVTKKKKKKKKKKDASQRRQRRSWELRPRHRRRRAERSRRRLQVGFARDGGTVGAGEIGVHLLFLEIVLYSENEGAEKEENAIAK